MRVAFHYIHDGRKFTVRDVSSLRRVGSERNSSDSHEQSQVIKLILNDRGLRSPRSLLAGRVSSRSRRLPLPAPVIDIGLAVPRCSIGIARHADRTCKLLGALRRISAREYIDRSSRPCIDPRGGGYVSFRRWFAVKRISGSFESTGNGRLRTQERAEFFLQK